MTYEELQKAVEERVNARFLTSLLPALYQQHKKRGFQTNCECAYCQTKRRVSYARVYHGPYRYRDEYDVELVRKAQVDSFRQRVRTQLQKCEELKI